MIAARIFQRQQQQHLLVVRVAAVVASSSSSSSFANRHGRQGFSVLLTRRNFSSVSSSSLPWQSRPNGSPPMQGLYDPALEKDNCGVGVIANLHRKSSHALVRNALTVLERMHHRGGAGSESNTGDGAGMLCSLPDAFFRSASTVVLKKKDSPDLSGSSLPPLGKYGTGIVFFSRQAQVQEQCMRHIEDKVTQYGLRFLGWREVPTDNAQLGQSALACEPVAVMPFFAPLAETLTQDELEVELLLFRRSMERQLRELDPDFYFCSLSTRTIVYKGMLTADQLAHYYKDLADERFTAHVALVHSRFSTNTFPSWARAQPMRMLCHNGEINTLRGNINWMRARESTTVSPKLGERTANLRPFIDETQSDSGCYDNALETIYWGSGDRTLPECMLMMIPEPWQNDDNMSIERKNFYRYYSNLMEPWDGPAMVAFTDGRVVGATLDRNGLRPSRIYVTNEHDVIIASEVGTLSDVVEPSTVIEKTRLVPGQIFVMDLEKGMIVRDSEVKTLLAAARPYGDWCKKKITMEKLRSYAGEPRTRSQNVSNIARLLTAFGITQEVLDMMVLPTALHGKEPLGSMGNDAALAVLSDKPRVLFDYFKQLFAQVTNPPVDPIREASVMSLLCPVGPAGNILENGPELASRLELHQPLLSPLDARALRMANLPNLRCKEIDMTTAFRENLDGEALATEIRYVANKAADAVEDGYTIICLTDVGTSLERIPLPSLVVVGAVHHHLLRKGLRPRCMLMVEAGDAVLVHHFALLFGYGADAVYPHMLYGAVAKLEAENCLPSTLTHEQIVHNLQHGFDYGLRKIMAKMGISTLQSYKGAQIFEAVGVGKEIVDVAFSGTPSRIGGIGWDDLATDMLRFHTAAFPRAVSASVDEGSAWHTSSSRVQYSRQGLFDDAFSSGAKYGLPNSGDYHYRDGGEVHYNDPQQMVLLQQAVRSNSRDTYNKYKQISLNLVRGTCLRGQMEFVEAIKPIPLEEVESAAEICKRFTTGAMSLGSISREAHSTIAVAMNRIGGKSNTGEGGEDASRFKTEAESAIKQVASGRFGVTINYLTNARQLQIKMAQGAKPGEGGELPGDKVSVEIARLRHSVPGVGLISPPPHHDIYSIEDLAQLIHDLKSANPSARISVKLVSEVGVGVVAAGVAKAKADHILISGHDGGTGAAMWSGIKGTGLPWELGLAEAQQTLVLNDLRGRVILETDGQIKTGFDATVAFLLGAEEVGLSTAPLVSLGCIMMRKCHLNTCPVGIATQDPVLRAKFTGLPEHVINLMFLIAEEIREHMSVIGVRTVKEMIGRADYLRQIESRNPKIARLNLSRILLPARQLRPGAATANVTTQDHGLSASLDSKLIEKCQEAIENGKPVEIETPIFNLHRSVGATLSHHVAKKHGEKGLPDGTIKIKFSGSTGQSFGAFLAKGIEFHVLGDSNDGMAKGLSGGLISLRPLPSSSFVAEDNVIVGNAALYGATSGSVFIRGKAGERFCVRNSGAAVVVEGLGDHGLEYMTGGRAVCLGSVGRNFSAGMSGGLAWVYDKDKSLASK